MEAQRRLVQSGDDELLAGDREEEDATEDGEGLIENFKPVYCMGTGILEFVAQGGTKEKVGEIGVSEVLRVCDVAERTCELER